MAKPSPGLGKSILIGGAALVVAGLSLSAAMANVAQADRALLVANLFPANGFAKAEAAEDLSILLLAPESGVDDPRVEETARALALEALEHEPLAQTALRTLALLEMRKDEANRPQARELMRESARVSRRDRATMLWLVEDYGRLGETEPALEKLDLALRRGGVSESYLLPILAQSLAQPGSADIVDRMLAKRPPWADEFWLAVAKVPEVLPVAAELRQKVARRGIEVPQETDAALLSGLVRQGAMEEAAQLRTVLPGADSSSLVRNASFEKQPLYPPFDWQLTNTGDYGGEILQRQNALLLNALPDAGGTVARQLVALEGGSYRMSVKAPQPAQDATAAEATLACASGRNSTDILVRLQLDAQEVAEPFVVDGSSCPYQWLEMRIFVEPGGIASDVLIDEVSIQKVD